MASFTYANEADLLNMALFSMTAKQWRDKNPTKDGNIRDYATVEQLIVLSNLESLNALLVSQNIENKERLLLLNSTAITQIKSLIDHSVIKRLK